MSDYSYMYDIVRLTQASLIIVTSIVTGMIMTTISSTSIVPRIIPPTISVDISKVRCMTMPTIGTTSMINSIAVEV